MYRSIIILVIFTSALSAQQRFAVPEVGELQSKYHFGMTVKEAHEVSTQKFPTIIFGMQNDFADYRYSGSENGAAKITITWRKKLDVDPPMLRFELNFMFDTLYEAALTLYDAEQIESDTVARQFLHTTPYESLITKQLVELLDTTIYPAGMHFHISKMNDWTFHEECDSDGRWHDMWHLHRRFTARYVHPQMTITNESIGRDIRFAESEIGIMVCPCPMTEEEFQAMKRGKLPKGWRWVRK